MEQCWRQTDSTRLVLRPPRRRHKEGLFRISSSIKSFRMRLKNSTGEDDEFLLFTVPPVHTYLLHSKCVMRSPLSLSVVHYSNAKNKIILGLKKIYTIYSTVGVGTIANVVQQVQVLGR